MIREIAVQAKADHVASLANGAPTAALEELVWNALDADAREVRIDLVTNALGGIDAVRVTDDGTGIDVSHADETFGSLGGSWKNGRALTGGLRRRIHGRHGRGRFKAFALGCHVEWRTTAAKDGKLQAWTLSGDVTEPGLFRAEDAKAGSATGTEVYITNVRANADSLLDAGTTVQTLASKFALYLKAYPDVRIFFMGLPVTPVIVRKATTSYKLALPDGSEAKLEVIEWKRRFVGSGRLVFCGADGFALHDVPAGVRPGAAFSFTAYAVSPRITALAADNALVMDELHPEVRAYLDAARKTLRDHFRVRAAEEDASRVKQWIAEGSYPFAADDTTPERAKFDAGIADLRAHVDGFDALAVGERRYLFDLVRKTLG